MLIPGTVAAPTRSYQRLVTGSPLQSTDVKPLNVGDYLPTDTVGAAQQTAQQAQTRFQGAIQQAARQRLIRLMSQQFNAQVPRQSPTGLQMPQGQLGDWIHQALAATGHTGPYSNALAAGLRNMIKHEDASLDPRATNNWDSNAKAGTPSIGLMQTIQPTFNQYAIKGHRNIYNPVDNIIAGLRYALSRYGRHMVMAGGRYDANGNYIGY